MAEAAHLGGRAGAPHSKRLACVSAWLALVLIALSHPGRAGTLVTAPATTWQAFGESEASLHFYDPASVRADGNLRRVWRLFDFRVQANNGVGSGMALIEINCANSTYRYLRTMYFAGTQGRGQYLGGSSEAQFDHMAPGSMIARLASSIC